MFRRKRKSAYNVFCRSAHRVTFFDALADPDQYPFAPDMANEDDITAFHVFLDGYFFLEITMDGVINYQVLTETMHPIFDNFIDAEKELYDMWKKEIF